MKKYVVTLTNDERKRLSQLTSKGKHRSQKILNALILLACDEGEHQQNRSKNEEIAKVLNTSMRKIDRTKKRFVMHGFDVALKGQKSSRIYSKKVDGDFEAHLIALSCSDPPKGHARWTLRLLADKAVELQYVDNISHETVRRVLKKTKSSLGSAKALDGLKCNSANYFTFLVYHTRFIDKHLRLGLPDNLKTTTPTPAN